MKIKKILIEDVFDDDEFDDDEPNYNFENDIIKLFSEIVNKSGLSESFEEEFDENEKKAIEIHFDKHCLGDGFYHTAKKHGEKKKSTNDDVLYDFKTIEEYKNRIKFVDNLSNVHSFSSVCQVSSVMEALYDLLNGECTVYFKFSCGFKTAKGIRFSLKIHSYSNDVTTNFKGNTVEWAAYKENGYNRTQFAMSFNELVNKINILKERHYGSSIIG